MTTQHQGLAEAFKFSQADLRANQQGMIGDDQKRVIESRLRRRIWLIFAIVGGPIFLCLGFSFGLKWLYNPEPILVRWVLGSIGLLIGTIAFVHAFVQRNLRKLLASEIRQVEGPAKLLRKVVSAGEYSSATLWYVKIGSKDFLLPNSAQIFALDEGASYRVYYLEAGKRTEILSVEPLDSEDMRREEEIPIIARNEKLAQAFKFSETDLLFNRHGKITESQKQIFKAHRKGIMRFFLAVEAFIFLFFGLVIGYYRLTTPEAHIPPWVIRLGLGSALLVALSGAFVHFRLRKELAGGVRYAEGQVKFFRSDYSSTENWFVKIGSQEYPLDTVQYEALKGRSTYRVYYAKAHDYVLLLSVEAV